MFIETNVFCTAPHQADNEAAYYLSDSDDMSAYGWVLVRKGVKVEFEPMNPAEAARVGVEHLRKKQQEARAAFEVEMMKINEQINKLLSLEMS